MRRDPLLCYKGSMCIVAFALNSHPRYPLILAANRDEFFSRPTAPASFWEDAPAVLAGRDLAAGGTWLGVTGEGRVAAVTYFREPLGRGEQHRSRGLLAADFLTGDFSTGEYIDKVLGEGGLYGGFNLLAGTSDDLRYLSNRGDEPVRVPSGVHAMSNGPLDSRWPKVLAARERLSRLLKADDVAPSALLDLLAQTERFPDEMLPDTGIGIERERFLSSVFIRGEEYGTRSSTVLLVDAGRRITLLERTFNPDRSTFDTLHEIEP